VVKRKQELKMIDKIKNAWAHYWADHKIGLAIVAAIVIAAIWLG
jgi:hypothetical protein